MSSLAIFVFLCVFLAQRMIIVALLKSLYLFLRLFPVYIVDDSDPVSESGRFNGFLAWVLSVFCLVLVFDEDVKERSMLLFCSFLSSMSLQLLLFNLIETLRSPIWFFLIIMKTTQAVIVINIRLNFVFEFYHKRIWKKIFHFFRSQYKLSDENEWYKSN